MLHRRTALVGTTIALLAACIDACSSFEGSDPPPAATPDAAVETDAVAPDGRAPGCLVAPADPAGEPAFCALEKRYFERCGKCEECRQRNVNDCAAYGAGLSAGFKKLLGECSETLACGEIKALYDDPCVEQKLATIELSPAQRAVKDGYCNACPDRATECTTFYARGDDGGGGFVGKLVALMNDELAEKVRQGCGGILYCDPGLFALCAYGKLCDYYKGKDNCDPSFCR